MRLNDIFAEAMMQKVTIGFETRQQFDNLRTQLVRKLRRYNELNSSMGLPSDTYLRATYNKDKQLGAFEIVPTEDRIRIKHYDVQVTDI